MVLSSQVSAVNPCLVSHHGESTRCHHTAQLDLSERVYSPSSRTTEHLHDRAFVTLILEGEFSDNYGLKTHVCPTSTVLFYPAREPHSGHFGHLGGRTFVAEVAPDWLEHTCFDALSDPITFHRGSPILLCSRLYKEFRDIDAASPLIMEGLILEIIGEIIRGARLTSAKPPDSLRSAIEFIHSHFTSCFTIADVARVVGIHPVHLAQSFRKHQRCTVGEYVRRLRIELAAQELLQSNASLAEIAASCGFSDQSHFTRMFQRYLGLTPRQYRVQRRRPNLIQKP